MHGGSKFAVGDPVIYRKVKASPHPGPRAEDIRPTEGGEDYLYEVDKFWIVSAILDGGQLECTTRRGKVHRLRADDPNLHKANWLERWWHRDRFPQLGAPPV